ncbi:Predicted 3-hydroxylacyl-ACP dehydratase, HotDog domain [Microbulbifer donghaiensis]|uniref:Predicted 3-hydroxylacyl-ACP dehydratase, HotDog domain n=1 Tax=Microbulbifer donghaiensis TaxID=494016 RepID=A0A1M5B158_9GAMM|nr:hotdog family protein [Microbulbifer donghaiensis]SHF36301.1 Predicted 3-hydroxylacyl-ACP dehydratase, HotDog domain [Microbulbifer donghaiensis]
MQPLAIEEMTAEELVPHSGDMSLLDTVVAVGEETLTAKLRVRDDGIFARDGRVPAYVGIEYMAQAVAAFSGYHARARGEAVRLGFLLGTRKFNSNIDSYQCGDELTVEVERLLQAENGMATFECRVSGAGVQQAARLNVYQPDNIEAYLKEKF